MSLRDFYDDHQTRNEVQEFLIHSLGEHAKDLAFKGESTVGIGHAKNAIEKAFSTLRDMFEPKVKPKTQNRSR